MEGTTDEHKTINPWSNNQEMEEYVARQIDEIRACTGQISTDTAIVKVKLTAIEEHLAKVNGRIGRVEEAAHRLQVDSAAREIACDVHQRWESVSEQKLISLESRLGAAEKEQERDNSEGSARRRVWLDVVTIVTLLAAITALVLDHWRK